MPDRPRVLFLCTGNSARSQMGEALLRNLAGQRFEALSAGTAPKGVHPLTIRVLEEIGVSTIGLRSKHMDEFVPGGVEIDTAIVVCDQAAQACPAGFPGAKRTIRWSFNDPAAATGSDIERLGAFRRIRDLMRAQIEAWLREQIQLSVA